MLVSILVPIYGVEKYIEKCVVSLFEQDYKNIEYIFINDCTKDKSIEVLKEVLERYPERKPFVKIINHDTNRGLASARNTAIANSSGEFVFVVDSDDWISTTTISKAVNLAVSDDSDIVNVGVNVHYEDRIVSKIASFKSKEDNILALLDKSVYCNIWGRLIKRSLFVDNEIKCIDGANMGEDFCQITKLMYFANKVSYVNEPLYSYNCMNSGGYTINYSYNHIIQVWKNYDDVCSFFVNKGDVYRNKLDICYLKLICDHIRISKNSKDGNKIFEEERSKLKGDKMRYKKDLKLSDRIIISLSVNKLVVYTFLSLLSSVKKCLKK